MCGIFGYFDRGGRELKPEALSAMGSLISHRGPDGHGVHEIAGAAVGNRRLAIIDPKGGVQPFFSDDGKIAVVQNGEIYNFVELAQELAGTPHTCRTKSDTEVLLRLYEREGMAFLPKLNGMFAFAILDARDAANPLLHLARDRVGVKPLYVHEAEGRTLFGSEIKSLLAAGAPAQADPVAIHHYLGFNYVPPPWTAFKGVRHLMPGRMLTLTRSGSRESAWWELPTAEASAGVSEKEWIERINETIHDGVRLRLRADVAFGAFLSGGTDSSAVVGHMAGLLERPVKTFTIGFTDPRYDESPYALEASRRFRTEHVCEKVEPNLLSRWPLAIYHCDQPHGDVSFLPTHRVSELAARQVKMVLTGDGGDELFAGYEKYAAFFARLDAGTLSQKDFRRAYFESISLFSAPGLAEVYAPEFRKAVGGSDTYSVAEPWFEKARAMDRINQALFLDTALLLPGNNLVKPDRMGMAVSIEARDPLLDPRLIELAFAIPGRLKLSPSGETKHIFKKAIEPLIGHELAYRKKQMFTVPVGEWFKRELRDFTREVLLDGPERGIFQRDRVEGMLIDHETGRTNRTREIRALVALELWHRIFIDARFDHAPSFAEIGVKSRV